MPNRRHIRLWKGIVVFVAGFSSLLCGIGVFFYFDVTLDPPAVSDLSALRMKRIQAGPDCYTCGRSWIRKNPRGLWEMYVEGRPFERGVIIGKLSEELICRQERAFVNQIRELVPSGLYLFGLKLFVAWFDRHLDVYVPEEYKEEIYGLSESASEEFHYIGTKYQRILNYHAAHDIGHALQGANVIECTSFAVWDTASADASLLVGRNFDFYVGDDFARDKLVCFINPSEGHKFMMMSWGGMIGAVSGMNEAGLTVTLNAARTEPPTSAATPISIIAREILQYAGNIEEAFAIARKRDSFVSESILIGSQQDNRAALIEKSPTSTVLVESSSSFLISTNHFQSPASTRIRSASSDAIESTSRYRFQRVRDLMDRYGRLSSTTASAILRDRRGVGDRNIGMGNEKAINQLIAHHSIIFNPAKKLVWVSSNPYQLGEYVAYDLSKVFSLPPMADNSRDINEERLTIPADPFYSSIEYRQYEEFRRVKKTIKASVESGARTALDPDLLRTFVSTNPEYFEVYSLLGDYSFGRRDTAAAREYYLKALEKEVASAKERDEITRKLNDCNVHSGH